MDLASVDGDLVIAVQSFASGSRALDIQDSVVDGDEAVGLDAGAGSIVQVLFIVFIFSACQDGGSSAVHLEIAIG